MRTQYFCFGQIYTTPKVNEYLSVDEIIHLLLWHGQLKAGELGEDDQKANRDALIHGGRIFSCYSINGMNYFVITESDRSMTTVLRADEY